MGQQILRHQEVLNESLAMSYKLLLEVVPRDVQMKIKLTMHLTNYLQKNPKQ